MNYLEMANEILNYAANKPEYAVQTYFDGPRVTVEDSDNVTVFHYERRGRDCEEMRFEYNGKMFHYVTDNKGCDYWTRDMKTGKIEDSNENEFFNNGQKFADEMGGDIYWMA